MNSFDRNSAAAATMPLPIRIVKRLVTLITPPTLQGQMLILVFLVVLGSLFVSGAIFITFIGNVSKSQISKRALDIGHAFARMPSVQQILSVKTDHHRVLQQLAEQIRKEVEAEFIVIADAESRRYSHPDPEKIGQRFVGGDERRALDEGVAYVSEAVGTLGPSLRSIVPIFSPMDGASMEGEATGGNDGKKDREIIGFVSVGYLQTHVMEIVKGHQREPATLIFMLFVVVLLGATGIAGYVKRQILGMEPKQISSLYLRKLEEELRQTREFSEMLRVQSHEYSNKLHRLAGLLQMEAYGDALALVTSESSGLQSLIAFLSQAVPHPSLAAIIMGKFNRAHEMKIDFQINPDSSMADIPNGFDHEKLVTILGNLMDNALEAAATYPDRPAQVALFMTDIGIDLIFEIEDSGGGVPIALLEKIFSKGFTTKSLDNETNRLHGIGLYLVDECVKEMNGFLTVSTGELGGALFTLSIPKHSDDFGKKSKILYSKESV